MTWPEVTDFDLGGGSVWDRRPGEPTKAYTAFRVYRDLPSTQRRIETVAEATGFSPRRCWALAAQWEWVDRATGWDDACHRVDDQERLEAIRSMHRTHRQAGRAALGKALQALALVEPGSMTPTAIARLMELGARLERSTLTVSVEELQGLEVYEEDAEDPWERIAAELDPNRGDPADAALG